MKIGRHGQLQEWWVDWDNPEDQHSHVSHLYGLYPSSQINRRDTPKLFEAARTSLIQRGTPADGPAHGESRLWARAGDGDRAHKNLNHVIHRLTANLFNGRQFQIDANFGARLAWPRCSCKATAAKCTCYLPYPRLGRLVPCKVSAHAVVLKLTFIGRITS